MIDPISHEQLVWVGCFRQSNRCAMVSGATPHSGHMSNVPGKMRTLTVQL